MSLSQSLQFAGGGDGFYGFKFIYWHFLHFFISVTISQWHFIHPPEALHWFFFVGIMSSPMQKRVILTECASNDELRPFFGTDIKKNVVIQIHKKKFNRKFNLNKILKTKLENVRNKHTICEVQIGLQIQQKIYCCFCEQQTISFPVCYSARHNVNIECDKLKSHVHLNHIAMNAPESTIGLNGEFTFDVSFRNRTFWYVWCRR